MISPRTFSFRNGTRADVRDRWRAWLTQIAQDHERQFVTDVLTDPDIDEVDVDELDELLADHRRCWADVIEADIPGFVTVFVAVLDEPHIGLN